MKYTLTTVLLAAVLVLAPAAAAHEDRGEISFTKTEVTGFTIAVEVSITYPNDGEAAGGATVTAVAQQQDTSSGTPVPLTEAAPGTYAGSIEVPSDGAWTVRVTSLSPAATAETVVEVAAPPTTTMTRVTTTEAATDATVPLPDEEDDAAEPRLWVIVLMVVLALGLGFVLWKGTRNRRADEEAQP